MKKSMQMLFMLGHVKRIAFDQSKKGQLKTINDGMITCKYKMTIFESHVNKTSSKKANTHIQI